MTDQPIVVTDSGLSRQSPNERSPRSSRYRGGASNVGLVILTILTLGGFGTLGWFAYSTHSTMEQMRNQFIDRITALEDRLNINVETSLEADASVEVQLEFWESEIRKLWDLSNKRNRPDIEQLQSNFATLQGLAAVLKEDLAAIKLQTEDNANTILQNSRSLRDLVDTVNSTNQLVITNSDQIENRVKKTEEAIEAIDSYRIQNNNWIRDLQRRVSDLELE